MTMSSEGFNRARLADTLKRLRVARAGSLAAANARHREWRAVRKAIASHLASGESTVPAIAEATQIASSDVLWHVSAMRKYGLIEECGMTDDYPTYRRRTVDATNDGEE